MAVNTAYLTYSYEPKLYYDNIIKTWQVKLAKDSNKLKNSDKKLGPKTDDDASFNYSQFGYESVAQAYTDLKGYYYKKAQIEDKIDEQIALKRAAIQAFERTMGPAIREGYWQPEDYTDYGDEYTYESLITQNDITADSGNEAIIAWDTELFDDEDPIYYQIGVNQVTEYYPCLDLTMIFTANNITNIPTDLDEYSILWKATYYSDDTTYDFDDLKDIQIMAVGSKALIRYMKDGNTIKPILVLIGAKTFTPSQLERLILTGDARIEKYSTEVVNSELQIHHDNIKNIPPEAWLCYRRRGNTTLANEGWSNDLLNKYELLSNNTTKQNVLPRIKFSSLSLKTNSSNLVIELVTTKNNNETKHLLTMAEDYYVNTRDTKRTSTTYYLEYYITIKPETLIKYGYDIENTKVRVQYVLSNANTAIFLDAQKISKENAFPKVSYNVTTNLLNPGLTHTLYNTLAQIIMINDIDLKFEDVFGYISQVDLDLDQPQQDTVEIKNYSTKFEDLFSTIVASTESMKKNEGRLSMAMGGDIPLTSDALGESLSNAGNVFDAYLDSHFDTSEVVINKLADIFSEAGKILGESKKSLQKLSALTLDNANILSGFAQNVMAELTGQVFRSAEKPMSFSPGDIWIQEDEHGNIIARYVATSRSEDLNDTTGTNGFVRTYDGKLASITGASLNVNADDGIIDITAKNNINIMSGGYLYLASNDIDIVGNHSVNIGGATINIATLTEEGETYEAGGINLISTSMQNGISVRSEVLLSPFSITMGAADIFMRGGRKIQMVTSDGSSANTSAIELSPETGIWIGSGKGLRLFGGGFVYDADTAELSTPVGAQGASVELNSEHLILGYANTASNTGTAIEMTEGGMILAAGNYLDHGIWEKNHYYSANTIVLYNGKYYRCIIAHSSGETWQQSNWTEYEFVINGTTSGLIGAKFTANSIGFATMSTVDETTYINAILMDDTNGITIGSGTSTHPLDITAATQTLRNSSGSYVRISSDGIDLGSLSDLYINSNNFKLQTNVNDSGKQTVLAIGSNLQVVNDKTVYDATNGQFGRKNDDDSITLYSAGNQPAIDLIINQKGLYLTGTVYATAGSFTGTVTATSFTTNENSSRGYFKADNTAVGFFRKNDNNVENILTLDTSGKITADKALTISAADGLTISSTSKIAIISGADINITSTNFVVNSEASGNSNLFFAGLTSSDIPNFSSNTVYSVGAMVQYSNKYYQFINAHAAGTWKAADVKEIALPSMTLNTTNGLTIVGKINANELQIEGSDGESWVQSKVTDSFIWMGVKNATAGTSLELTDTKMTLSSNNTSILIDSTKGIEIKGRTIKIMGAPADNDNSAVSGTLYVSTDNVIINTAATTTNAILRIGSENDPAILYSLSNGLTIKGKITALAGGTIGGWNIGSTGLTSGNMGIYSSGTYSINSNNAFMVDFNGNVWLNSLKVWNGSSYDTINLSGNFNEAVSYASGAWSGSEFIATLKLFKNDRITKEVKLQASVVDPIVELDWDASSRTATYSVGVDLQIGGVSHASSQAGYFWFEDRTLLWQYSDPIFESGWAAAADFTAEYDADHISFTGLPTNTVDDFSGTISAADPYAAGYKKGWKDCKTVCAGSTNTYYTGTPRLIRPSGASQDIWVIENYTEVSVTEYNDPGDPS